MTNDIGRFIQEMRKQNGMTQKELAEQIGISDKTVSKWENGNGTPDTSMLLSLCQALGITVNELLSCERIPPENYPMKAEETIMTLMKENESVKKGNQFSRLMGGLAICVAVIFLAISNCGISFPFSVYFDVPSMIILCLMVVGTVLISGVKGKERILGLLNKTILPIGTLVSLFSFVVAAYELTDLGALGPNMAIIALPIMYCAIVKIVVAIQLERIR